MSTTIATVTYEAGTFTLYYGEGMDAEIIAFVDSLKDAAIQLQKFAEDDRRVSPNQKRACYYCGEDATHFLYSDRPTALNVKRIGSVCTLHAQSRMDRCAKIR